MKKLLGIIALFIAVFTMSSCSDNSPKGVAKKAISCMQAKDWNGYVDLLYFDKEEGKDIDKEKEQLAALFKEKGEKELNKQGGIKSYEIVSEEISEDGNTATVTVKIVYGDGTEKNNEEIKMKKDANGDWKISLGK